MIKAGLKLALIIVRNRVKKLFNSLPYIPLISRLVTMGQTQWICNSPRFTTISRIGMLEQIKIEVAASSQQLGRVPTR
jgi:hypothetical protein